MVAFIDAHRKTYGVEPICRELPIAPSTYFRHKLLARDPTRRSARAHHSAHLDRKPAGAERLVVVLKSP
jgi:putative transposase